MDELFSRASLERSGFGNEGSSIFGTQAKSSLTGGTGGGNNGEEEEIVKPIFKKKKVKPWKPPGRFARLLDALGFNQERRKKENDASIKIQCIIRRHQARQRVKLLIHRRFLKLYDVETNEYVYKDKLTRLIFDRKPYILPDEEDLVTPRPLEAPMEYDPDYDDTEKDGFAIVITVNSFVNSDRIPDLPVDTTKEHDRMIDVLSHDYICKFSPSRVLGLLNPTVVEVKDAFEMARKKIRKHDFLLVYLCTHIGTAFKGDKKNKKETGYILLHDSEWTLPVEIAKTSISLTTFAHLLNSILAIEKTVIINCAHVEKPSYRFFATKELYPPPNCYSRIADEARCTVIGNCSINEVVSETIWHVPLPRVVPIEMPAPTFAELILSGSKLKQFDLEKKVSSEDVGVALNATNPNTLPPIPLHTTAITTTDSTDPKKNNINDSNHPVDLRNRKKERKKREAERIAKAAADKEAEIEAALAVALKAKAEADALEALGNEDDGGNPPASGDDTSRPGVDSTSTTRPGTSNQPTTNAITAGGAVVAGVVPAGDVVAGGGGNAGVLVDPKNPPPASSTGNTNGSTAITTIIVNPTNTTEAAATAAAAGAAAALAATDDDDSVAIPKKKKPIKIPKIAPKVAQLNDDFVSEITPDICADIFKRLIQEWQIEMKPPLMASKVPPEPGVTWKKDAETNYQFQFTMPTDTELIKYERDVIFWGVRRAVGPPVNYLRQWHREREDNQRRGPAQVALLTDSGTVFGSAVIKALSGDAAAYDCPVVTAEMLYLSIYRIVKQTVETSKTFPADVQLTGGGVLPGKKKPPSPKKKKKKKKGKKKKDKKKKDKGGYVSKKEKRQKKNNREVGEDGKPVEIDPDWPSDAYDDESQGSPQASIESLESLDEDDELAAAALVEKFVLSPMMVIPRSKGAIELPSHRNPPPKLTENGTSVITTLPPIPKTDGTHSVYARPPPKVFLPPSTAILELSVPYGDPRSKQGGISDARGSGNGSGGGGQGEDGKQGGDNTTAVIGTGNSVVTSSVGIPQGIQPSSQPPSSTIATTTATNNLNKTDPPKSLKPPSPPPPTVVNSTSLVLNTVCLRCSPPPPPFAPQIEKVTRNEVLMRWDNPAFSGMAPTKYRVYSKNCTRLWNHWEEVYNSGGIRSNTFLARNLPAAVECEFAVTAFNNGGWGAMSLSSGFVCPGFDIVPISTTIRKARLAEGGQLTVIDRLLHYAQHREEQVWGLNRLLSFASVTVGYPKKGNIQRKVALAALHALKTFPRDPEILSVVFFLLGWTLRGPAKDHVRNILLQHDIIKVCDDHMKWFRFTGPIIGGISWLRCNMPAGEINHPDPIPPEKDKYAKKVEEDLEDTDEDEPLLLK